MTLEQLVANLQKTFEEWREAFDKMLERLGAVEKAVASVTDIEAKAREAAAAAINTRLADKGFIESLVQAMVVNPKAIEMLVKRILESPAGMAALAKAVSAQNREFRQRVDAIKEIIGIHQDDHADDRKINAAANLSMDEGITAEHMKEFVEREQSYGNLPDNAIVSTLTPPVSPDNPDDDAPAAPDPLLPADATIIMENIVAITDETRRDAIPASDLKRLVNGFACRGEATRHLSHLVERLTGLDPDILKVV